MRRSERASSSTSTIEMVIHTDLHSAINTSHLPTAHSSLQSNCSSLSKRPMNFSQHMCICTMTTQYQVSTSMTTTLKVSMQLSLSRRKWKGRKASIRAIGTPFTLLHATWRKTLKWATASSQLSWSQSTRIQINLGKWTLLEVQPRALKNNILFRTTLAQKTVTLTCSISVLLEESLRLMKKFWGTMYRRLILRRIEKSRTRAGSSNSIWARMRRERSRRSSQRHRLQLLQRRKQKQEKCLTHEQCVCVVICKLSVYQLSITTLNLNLFVFCD